MDTALVKVGGMSCQGCVKSVTNILLALPGIVAAEVSLERGDARVEFDPTRVSCDEMKRAIDDGGFEAG
jgi:copper chaperone